MCGHDDEEDLSYPLRCATADYLPASDEDNLMLFRRSRLLRALRDLSQSGPRPIRAQTAASGRKHLQGESVFPFGKTSPALKERWTWPPLIWML